MNPTKWRVAHASVIGASHQNQNTECQDSFACRTIPTATGEIFAAVVADGAGSTEKGQVGARIACETFIEEVSDFLQSGDASVKSLNADFGKHWINFFRQKIEEIAKRDGKEIREYASTLVAAVIGEKNGVFYQLGDGAIVCSTEKDAENYRFAVAPAESLYVNMTDFLTDDDAANNLRFETICETIEDLILFSDGIFPVAVNYQTGQPHKPFLKPLVAPLKNGVSTEVLNEKLAAFLASAKINEKSDDDKTIILASRTMPEISGAATHKIEV